MLPWETWFILALARVAVSQVAPYVIFTTQFGVHRMQYNGSSAVEDLVVGGHGYSAVDYHYARNLLFWINDATNTIHKARLSDGSSGTVLSSSTDPVDLTVDWINDKLYWVDGALCNVHEFNIMTNATRFVLSTGTSETSFPRGIVIYPYKDNGWLYWTDQTSGSLEMGSINGGDRESLIANLPCVQALTIDYSSHTVYWADTCIFSFQSISLNGDRETLSYPFSRNVFFVSSMGMFEDNLFWVEPTGIYTVQRSGQGYRAVMAASSTRRPRSMQVVHPSQQPPDEQYRELIMNPSDTVFVCDPPCIEQLGTCIPPGLCACKRGWMGVNCGEDMDECTAQTDGCEHICTNTIGDYNCSCHSGYSLSNNSRNCLDIDECATNSSGCEHICSNFAGGYECGCNSGYFLSTNLHTCTDIDECVAETDGCEQICTNFAGGYNCSCQPGYSLSNNSKNCLDIDECATNSSGCDQLCSNFAGGYECGCNSGYLLSTNLHTCTDIDECVAETDGCEEICTNFAGGYNCSCHPGYSLSNNSKNCLDIDECSTNSGGCEQLCSNTAGSYECSCNPGYLLSHDLHSCTDIDECRFHYDKCQQMCTNLDGGYSCSCYSGYSLDNNSLTCTDIDECATGSDDCQQMCTNHGGSFHCSCEPGYFLNDDGKTCTLIEMEDASSFLMPIMTIYSTTSSTATASSTASLSRSSSRGSSATISALPIPSLSSGVPARSTPSMAVSLPPPTTPAGIFASSSLIGTFTTMPPSIAPSTDSYVKLSSPPPLLTTVDSSHTLGVTITPLTSGPKLVTLTLSSVPIGSSSPHSSLGVSRTPSSVVNTQSQTAKLTTIQLYTTSAFSSQLPSLPTMSVYSSPMTGLLTTSVYSSPMTGLPTTSVYYSSITASVYSSPVSDASTAISRMPSTKSVEPIVTTTLLSHTVTSSKSASHSVARTSAPESSLASAPSTTTVPGTSVSSQVETTTHHKTTLKPPLVTTHSSGVHYSTTRVFSGSTTSSSHYKAPKQSSQVTESSMREVGESSDVTSGLNITPSVQLSEARHNLQWYKENKLALIIVAIVVLPALIGVLVLGLVLWYRRWHDRGSWSPNHDLSDVVVEQSVIHVATADNGHVSMSSFRSLHEENGD